MPRMPKIKNLNHEGHPELNKRTHLTGQAKKKWNEKKSGDRSKMLLSLVNRHLPLARRFNK